MLVFAPTEQIGTQASAPTNHLPEFDPGFNRLGKHKVDHLRHVDTGVQHVDRNSYSEVVIRFFELLDQRAHIGDAVVDNLADLDPVLRVEFAEESFEMLSVILALSEDDCLAYQRAGFILDAVVDQVFQNNSISVFTEDLAANVLAGDGRALGLLFAEIFLELGLLFVTQISVMDAITQKIGG
ncbi:hypothetical protein D3C77_248230 [compost metagenome]